MFVLVLGWVAAVVNSFFTLPQVAQVVRTRSVAGVSVLSWQITLGANLGWTAHGLLTGYVNLWLPNVVLLLCTTTILTVVRRQIGHSWAKLVAPGLGLAAVMVSLDLFVGPIAFAVAAFVPSGLAQLMQLRSLVHRVNVSGVSMTFLALSVVTQIIWLFWALLVGEVSVAFCAIALGTLMSANLLWALLRRYRLVQATLATF